MKRLLNLRLSFSTFLIVLLIFSICTILFGSAVRHKTLNGPLSDNPLFEFAEQIALIPDNTIKVIGNILRGDVITGEKKEFAVTTHLDKKLGLSLISSNPDDLKGYLLIPLFDPTDPPRTKVHLIDIDEKRIIHTWLPDMDKINKFSNIDRDIVNLEKDKNNLRHPLKHPLLLKDGSLIFNGGDAPLIRVDKCSDLVWQIDGIFHHANEIESNKNFLWASSRNRPGNFKILNAYYQDDEISKIDIDKGEVIFNKSVTEILYDNNLEYLITVAYIGDDSILGYDRVHLNDIQFVDSDTDYWKQGDVFLSLRHISTILLYRPSTNKVIWFKQGPWIMQHDVDIINESTIGVFNNNNVILGKNEPNVNSQIIYYDFKNQIPSRPYKKLFSEQNIKSLMGGLFTVAENGDIVVDETDHSRVIRGDKEGNVKWQFIWNSVIHWSRYLSDQDFSETAFMLANTQCQN